MKENDRPTSDKLSRQVTDLATAFCKNIFEDGAGKERLARTIFLDGESKEEIDWAVTMLAANPAQPMGVFFYTKQPPTDPTILQVLRYPNVRIIETAAIEDDFLTPLLHLFDAPHANDLNKERRQRTLDRERSIISHGLGNALGANETQRINDFIQRARKNLSLEGTDEDIIAALNMRILPEIPGVYWDMHACFLDWDGTLYKENTINQSLLQLVRDKAGNMPLCVWTGGDVEEVCSILRTAGITDLDVCSKQDCNGIRATLVVDDEPAEILRNTYGFDSIHFIQPSDI